MESQLTDSNRRSELTTPTDAYLHKAWHVLSLLLTIGRPACPAELAYLCNLFPATPELIEFLCSIPNSPLLLTSDLFVTISSVALTAFGRYVFNFNMIAEFVPRTRLGRFGRKRAWEDVRTYYRKRKRLRSEFEYVPVAKMGAFRQNVDEEEDRIALASLNMIESACAKVKFHVDDHMKRSMITQSDETSDLAFDLGKLDKVMFKIPLIINPNAGLLCYGLKNTDHEGEKKTNTCLNCKEIGCFYKPECQLNFLHYERLPHILNPITVERVMACMRHPERSLMIGSVENPVVTREAEIDDANPVTRINFSATFCPEVDEQMIILPVEAANAIQVCKVIFGDEKIVEGRVEEPLIECRSYKGDTHNLPIDTTATDMRCEDDPEGKIAASYITKMPSMDNDKITSQIQRQVIFPANVLSVGHKQQTKSTSKLKRVQKDALNHRQLSKLVESSKVAGTSIEQQEREKDKKSFSMKQKLKYTKEKRENSKENREKPTSVSLNNQLEPRELPKFESFTVEEEEGSGGYGTVYRARKKNDGATFAIKCPHVNANKHHVHNELKMLERLGGKNFVIKYEGSFKSGNSDCLVLEHVEHDRPEVLKREIDVFQLQWYGYCMFKALAGLHKQGIVHRDVKPGNFLFSRDVSKGYLIDFNLAMDLHQKYGVTDKTKVGYDVSFDHIPLPHTKFLPPNKNRKFLPTKILEAVNQETSKGSKSLLLHKNLKKKIDQAKVNTGLGSRNIIKSQGGDGSGITSAKDATSTRTPSTERLREPMPSHGRKELISLVQEALQGPNHEAVSVPASKRKRVAAPRNVDRKLFYPTPMPLHSTGIAVAGGGLLKNKGDGKHKREGPCVGTKGFRAPEVLFRSPHQGAKVDIWSAGVTLLYLMTGRTPFVGDPDQNIKDIAKLRGSEDLWEVAKLHNCESSFPTDLLDIQSLTSIKLRDWCKFNTRRPDFFEAAPRSLFDLVDKCLTVNPRLRISAEDALRHEFFSPCHDALRKQRLLRQGLSLDSGTTHLLQSQQTSERFS